MRVTAAPDRDTFAAERKPVLQAAEDSLFASAKAALRRIASQKTWANALINRAEALIRKTYRQESGHVSSDRLRAAINAFRKDLEDSLADTTVPPKGTLDVRARALAASIATSAIALGTTVAAQEDTGEVPLGKVWLSMDDPQVRPAHRMADGQIVALDEKFTVAGVDMDRPGDMSAPIELWINCRCILGIEPLVGAKRVAASADIGDVTLLQDEYATGETMDPVVDPAADAPPPLAEADRIIPPDDPTPFWGVLAPEGVMSGDMRKFAPNALRTRSLPLPLSWQRQNNDGHDGSVVVANIERAWRRNNLVYGMGHFLTTPPEASEAIGMMAEGGLRGVSVDADDGTMEMQDRNGVSLDTLMEGLDPGNEDSFVPMDELVTVFTDARISGATLCHIPAFQEAAMYLGTVPDDLAPKAGEDLANAKEPALVAAGPVKTEDGPGWLTNPVDTNRLREYWVHGKGALKIDWGVPGDFNRCRTNLAQYVKPQYLSGYCANRHYDALGFWPGRPTAGETVVMASGEEMAPALSLVTVTAAGYKAPPAEWFTDPHLVSLSPMVVTESGRVFGHLAQWEQCHIGFGERACTVAPHSATNYAYFQVGSVLTAEGTQVPVGHITMDIGHAPDRASARVAAAHYDHTGAVAADIAVGEDEFGIWFSGAVRYDLDPGKVAVLRAAALSGDWREMRGEMEMVAALCVNVPGFPIPRTSLAASGGHQTSLVAAGIVKREPVEHRDIEDIVARAITGYLGRQKRVSKMADLANQSGRSPKAKMAALASGRK